jgi:hypothetical protein
MTFKRKKNSRSLLDKRLKRPHTLVWFPLQRIRTICKSCVFLSDIVVSLSYPHKYSSIRHDADMRNILMGKAHISSNSLRSFVRSIVVADARVSVGWWIILLLCVCIDSSNAFVILLPLPLLLLLLLLFDGSIIKFVPKRTRRGRSDNAAAAQRHGQALSGRLSAARRRRPAIIIIIIIIIITWSVWRAARIRGFGTWHVFSILFSLVVIRGVVYNILYYVTLSRAASRFIEISIAVVRHSFCIILWYFERAPKSLARFNSCGPTENKVLDI